MTVDEQADVGERDQGADVTLDESAAASTTQPKGEPSLYSAGRSLLRYRRPLLRYEGGRPGRRSFADAIADGLAMRIDPSSLLIGIYGECGDCKSTALDFIEQRLYESAAESVVCVRCNPWLYGDAIYANLGTTPEKVGKHLRQVGTVVRGVSLGTSTVTAACIVVQEGGGA